MPDVARSQVVPGIYNEYRYVIFTPPVVQSESFFLCFNPVNWGFLYKVVISGIILHTNLNYCGMNKSKAVFN